MDCYAYISSSPFQRALHVNYQYVPALYNQVLGMLQRVAKKGDKHLDLGCGEGDVMAAAMEFGLDSWGCEIDPFLKDIAAERFGDSRVIHLSWEDVDFGGWNLITHYFGPPFEEQVRQKAKREMRPGSRLVCFYGVPYFEVL